MTLGQDLADVLKNYGVNMHILGMTADTETLTIEVPIYDMDGEFVVQNLEALTTFIELPLNATKKVLL